MFETTLSQNQSTDGTGVQQGATPIAQTRTPTLITTQIALFFKQPLTKPEDLYADLNHSLLNRFDATPVIIPVPPDSQLNEIPIVQMRATTGGYYANLARSRADLILAGKGREVFDCTKQEEIKKSAQIFFDFFRNQKMEVKRIGFVTSFFLEEQEPDKVLSNAIFNSGLKKIPTSGEGTDTEKDVAVRYVTRFDFKETKINNLFAVERFGGRISGESGTPKGVQIVRDFNTIPEEDYSGKISLDYLKEFLDKAISLFKLDETKKLLWPTE